MVTLTDVDIIQLLRKNNLNQDTLQEPLRKAAPADLSASA